MKSHRPRLALISIAATVALAALALACSSTDPSPAPPEAPAVAAQDATVTKTGTTGAAAQAAPTVPPQPTTPAAPTAADTASKSAEGVSGGVLVTIGAGSMARYLVREQLARLDAPNDAIGTTEKVEGTIVFGADGSVDSAQSKITVDMASLSSDSNRRDGYVRSNTLETSKYPTTEIVVKSTPGLPWPLPSSGEVTFEIVGDVTIHGVTKELTWEATAQAGDGGSVSGTAKTNFTFDTFGMKVPSVFVVLSVVDNIRLEIDFSGTVSGG